MEVSDKLQIGAGSERLAKYPRIKDAVKPLSLPSVGRRTSRQREVISLVTLALRISRRVSAYDRDLKSKGGIIVVVFVR